MTVLQAKVSVPANETSDPVDISGQTDIKVIVSAGAHIIHVVDSDGGDVESTKEYRGPTKSTMIAKGFSLEVENTGDAAINIEVNA